MGKTRARVEVEGPVSEVEALWYDPKRWASFLEGFARVVSIEGKWPEQHAKLIWDSRREGRGRVVEQVTGYEPRVGQSVHVKDPKLTGDQRIEFALLDDGLVEVTWMLDYKLNPGTFGGPLVDVLFVRRAITDSMRRTLIQFARELEGERAELKAARAADQ